MKDIALAKVRFSRFVVPELLLTPSAQAVVPSMVGAVIDRAMFVTLGTRSHPFLTRPSSQASPRRRRHFAYVSSPVDPSPSHAADTISPWWGLQRTKNSPQCGRGSGRCATPTCVLPSPLPLLPPASLTPPPHPT